MKIISRFRNSEGEEIEIIEVTEGHFKGQLLLSIVDDVMPFLRAPHLLDEGTVDWLLEQLNLLKQKVTQ